MLKSRSLGIVEGFNNLWQPLDILEVNLNWDNIFVNAENWQFLERCTKAQGWFWERVMLFPLWLKFYDLLEVRPPTFSWKIRYLHGYPHNFILQKQVNSRSHCHCIVEIVRTTESWWKWNNNNSVKSLALF